MKNIVLILLILGLVLGLGFFSDWYIARESATLTGILDTLQEQVVENADPTQYAHLLSRWERSKHILEIFIDHQHVKAADQCLASLDALLTAGKDPADTLSRIDELRSVFTCIPQHMKLRVENIL